MFDWYKKKRLDDQVKFFGGERVRFVSVYARKVKPRIRIKNKKITSFDLSPRHSINSAAQAAHLQQQSLYSQQSLYNSLAESNIRAAQMDQNSALGFAGALGANLLSGYGQFR